MFGCTSEHCWFNYQKAEVTTNTASKKSCPKALCVKMEMTYEISLKQDRFKGNYCRVTENGAHVSNILSFKHHRQDQ